MSRKSSRIFSRIFGPP